MHARASSSHSDHMFRRENYGAAPIPDDVGLSSPISTFINWLAEADQAGIFEPNAFVLGTVDSSGKPTARTVLLRGVDEAGFYFYTNYQSRKGQAIESIGAGARVSMVFGWYSQFRQVLVEGTVHQVDGAESDAYFNTRPRDSQIAAWASDQSQPIHDRASLDAKYEDFQRQFESGDVPRPSHWGGYVIVPTRIEFWKGRSNRMHDRIEYSRATSDAPWEILRLQP